MLDHVDEISGAKRKQMLTEHAEDARISKRLATLQYDIETELDLDAVMGVAPDLTRLREVAREFELRQVIQRLDEELPEAVPQAPPEERIEVDVSEGTLADLDAGAIATSVQAERWAATDGGQIVAGEVSDLTQLAAELRERPLIAHDFKSAGEGEERPDGRRGARRARPRARHDGRRLPGGPGAPGVRARRPRRCGGARGRAAGRRAARA